MNTPDHQQPGATPYQIRLGSQWEFAGRTPADGAADNAGDPAASDAVDSGPAADDPAAQGPASDGPAEHRDGRRPRLKQLTDWSAAAGTAFRGDVRLVRRFGRPSGLAPGDRISLVVDSLFSEASVTLNGTRLSKSSGNAGKSAELRPILQRYEVSSLLQTRNQLVIEFTVTDHPETADMLRDVFLKIESSNP